MIEKLEPRPTLLLAAMLAAAAVAAPSSASASPTAVCGAAPVDPVCELHEPGAAVPWGRYQSRPLMLLPAWRFDALTDIALERDELARRIEENRRKAELHLASVVAAGIARETRLRSDLEACQTSAGTWYRWEVALLAVGVGVGAAAVGAVVGYVASAAR